MAGRHELADQVAVLLQRAYPSEVTKEDLIEQSGLSQKDLKGALDSLTEEGELDMLAEHYRWRDPSGEDNPPPATEEPASTDGEEEPAPLRTALIMPTGRSGRIIFEVTASFPVGEETDDEQSAELAQEYLGQIQNILGTALPDLGAVVGIRRLEIFDEPRVIFEAGGAPATD